MKPQQLDVSLEPSDLIAVDKAQWEQADKTIRELRAENERLREHLGYALGLYHLGQTTGYAGEAGADLPSSREAREAAYGFVCAITNAGWISQDDWPIWVRMYHLEFAGEEATDETAKA